MQTVPEHPTKEGEYGQLGDEHERPPDGHEAAHVAALDPVLQPEYDCNGGHEAEHDGHEGGHWTCHCSLNSTDCTCTLLHCSCIVPVELVLYLYCTCRPCTVLVPYL